MKRCKWCNLKNPLYIKYHDDEWGIPNFNEHYLFEMFILETFQVGLSWECVLNKRKDFEIMYDNFDIDKIIKYDDIKINELLSNDKLIKNKRKIYSSVSNSKIYKNILDEYGNFKQYLDKFTDGKIFYEINRTSNEISDEISLDLKKRGMKFVGTITIYAYLQAIGIINSHDEDCFLNHKNI